MFGTQLSFDDLEPDEPLSLGSMERIGESFAFGSMLVQLMRASGWVVEETKPFAGLDETGEHNAGVLIIARLGALEIKRVGATLADVAIDLFNEAMYLQGKGAREPVAA